MSRAVKTLKKFKGFPLKFFNVDFFGKKSGFHQFWKNIKKYQIFRLKNHAIDILSIYILKLCF